MKLPLSKGEYKRLEKVAEQEGLTVDQMAEVAILAFFRRFDPELVELAKKGVDPKALRVFEKS